MHSGQRAILSGTPSGAADRERRRVGRVSQIDYAMTRRSSLKGRSASWMTATPLHHRRVAGVARGARSDRP
jgi:hypothetical protein